MTRKAFNILMPVVLVSGTILAQESSDSVEGILKELNSYNSGVAKSAAVPVPAAAPAVEQPAVTASAAPQGLTEEELPAVLEESRALYVGGEFEKAQRGFEAIVKKDPDNIFARMYLRKIMERGHRKAEVTGMKEVSSAWSSGQVVRSYDISGDGVKKMELTDITESTDITFKFPEVDFPKGSSAVYQPKTNKLFVRNTRDNLTVLEEILDAMDISKQNTDIDQVEIEAKFVEVSEGTLEALGFEWDFDSSVSTGLEGNDITFDDSPGEPGGDGGLFASALRGSSQSPTLPFSQSGNLSSGNEVESANGDWSAFRFEDTFKTTPGSISVESNGSNPLEVMMTALDQTAGTDVLSAPRVVTKSGETATIRVGQLHYYPEVYEVGASEGNIVHVKYEDFSEKLLGVQLEVTPKIDGDQIELGLNPKINELAGWQHYTISPADSAYTYYQFRIGFKYDHAPIVARLPIFKKREINTEVTIADGSTIGMGGLINEKVESYEDKVPVLGSIPLVGRLFRNEGERAIKRNLMIFVTAKKVDPSGRINTARSFE